MWEFFNPRMDISHLGLIPHIILPYDSRPVSEQVAERYSHGGGWSPFGKGKWKFDANDLSLKYPEDPKLLPHAGLEMKNGETVLFYDMAILCVIHQDGSYDVIRMD